MSTKERRGEVDHALSSKYLVGEPCLVYVLVPFASLVHNDVDDLVLFADISCRRSHLHDIVDGFAEQRHIATRVVANGTDELAHILAVLSSPSETTASNKVENSHRGPEYVLELNNQHLLLAVGYPLLRGVLITRQTQNQGANQLSLVFDRHCRVFRRVIRRDVDICDTNRQVFFRLSLERL